MAPNLDPLSVRHLLAYPECEFVVQPPDYSSRGTVAALHEHRSRPSWDEYVEVIESRHPTVNFASNDLRFGYDVMPLETLMSYKFRNFEPRTLVVERVQTAFPERGRGYATCMLREAIEQCGRPVSSVRVESPNVNSLRWWESTVVRVLAESHPDIKVLPVSEEERNSAQMFGSDWELLT